MLVGIYAFDTNRNILHLVTFVKVAAPPGISLIRFSGIKSGENRTMSSIHT